MSEHGTGAAGVPPTPPPHDPPPHEPPPQEEPQPEEEPQPTREGSQRVLRRSADDRMIGGVAGGLGRYFGIDPTLIRIAFVLLLFAGGSGFLLYVIGWIVMPEQREGDAVGPAPQQRIPSAGTEVVGLILLVVGAFLLMRVLVPDVFAGRYVWPIALIVLGLALLLRGGRR